MIVTLIPFLLAGRFTPPDLISFENGTEVTYLIQDHATMFHFGDPDCTNTNFHLQTLFSCITLESSLQCRFHNTSVDSTPTDNKKKKLRKYVVEDIWAKKNLEQDSIRITYGENGLGLVWVPTEIGLVGYHIMRTLSRLLIIGVDLSTKQTGNFITVSNITSGHCRTHYFVTRSTPSLNSKSSIVDLFLIPQPNESLARSLEIEQYVEDPECVDKARWYSFFTAREIRKVNLVDIELQLISAENFIVMNNHNFTSFSKINTIIKNQKKNTKYIIDESITLSFQGIHSPKYSTM